MPSLDPIIGVNDVEASSRWYQALLGCKSIHGGSEFDVLADEDGEILFCLHRWGAHEHPTLLDPSVTAGNGLLLYFRVEKLDTVRDNARKLGLAIEEEVHRNPNSMRDEFSLRDPDGYYVTLSDFHRYGG